MTSSATAAPPAAGLSLNSNGAALVAAHQHSQRNKPAATMPLPTTESTTSTAPSSSANPYRPSMAPFTAYSSSSRKQPDASESRTATPTAPAAPSSSTMTSSTTKTTAIQGSTSPSTSTIQTLPPSTPPLPRTPVAVMAAGKHANDDEDSKRAGEPDGHNLDHAMPDAPSARQEAASSYENQPQPLATPVQSRMQADPSIMIPNDYNPANPYAMSSMNHQAYMMMALASMSEAAGAMSPPPTVTPSQVTLPTAMEQTFDGMGPTNSFQQAEEKKSLESFARIEFPDSVFQMTTYAVIIGRDQRAMMQARRDERRLEEYKRRVEENVSKGLPPPSPIAHDRGKFSKSYVSEEGGMLGPESEPGEVERPTKRRKLSTQGSSQHDNDESQLAQENMISNRQYVSHTPGAAAVDLDSLRPDPYHIPILGIHSPGPNIATKTKAISREHMKIAYNHKEGVFEAIPLHKNGFFCDDVHYRTDKVVLKSGDQLQIKDISFHFIINGVKEGLTGAKSEENPAPLPKMRTSGGKEMSFDFESHANPEVQDTSDELSDVGSQLSDFGEDDEAEAEGDNEAENDGEGEEDSEIVETVEAGVEADIDMHQPTPKTAPQLPHGHAPDMMDPMQQLMPQIPRKRGPGRPPKNGIMSKREQRLLKKQQQEIAKKTLPQAPPVEPPIKRKVGRPRKHPVPDGASDRPEKRKYKPRKPKGEDGAEGSDAERRAREKKEKKARPKSPR